MESIVSYFYSHHSIILLITYNSFPFPATTQLHNIEQALIGLHDYVKGQLEPLPSFITEVKDELRSLREDLTSLNSSVNDLSTCFEEHKNSTTAELAGLTIKMEAIDSKMETLDSKVETLDSNVQSSQENLTQQICAKLDTLTATTAQLSTEQQNLQTNISDVECTDSEESLELYQNLQNNLTHQLETIQSGLDTLIGPRYMCGGTGGWRRVVYLDMTDSSATCPSGWQLTGYSKRTCGRVSTGYLTCDSTTFPVSGGEYTRVCGRIKAYQWGRTGAFHSYHHGHRTTIDGSYVDGVSVTHGSPQQHIWTFAAGRSEGNPTRIHSCPCDASIDIHVPPFVGEDYFCESGVNEGWDSSRHYTLHPTDTLWDGEDCLPSSTCCSQHNPPYFIKQLPTPTTDDIEAKVCLYSSRANIAVELVELYVLDSSLDSKMETLKSKVETLDSRIQETHTQQINALNSKLDTLTATTAQLSTEHQNLQTDISDVECTDSEESLELYQNLQNNLTHQLERISDSLEHLAVHTCGGTGGWRRAVYLDMTDSSTICPSGWQLTGYSKRTCGRVSTGFFTCDSATFPVSGGEYTRVCGRIKAYQWGSPLAFWSYHNGLRTTIDGAYVNGVSVTHGSPQQHIWTFAAGAAEGNPTWTSVCPCDASIDIRVPPFVGEDYFCESGVNEGWDSSRHLTLHSTDTLWDGKDCLPSSTCCSQHNPPYFIKQLPTPTTDDIEARVCLYYQSHSADIANIAVELVELYVQ